MVLSASCLNPLDNAFLTRNSCAAIARVLGWSGAGSADVAVREIRHDWAGVHDAGEVPASQLKTGTAHLAEVVMVTLPTDSCVDKVLGPKGSEVTQWCQMQVALGTHLWRAPWAAYSDACKPDDGFVTLQVLRGLRHSLCRPVASAGCTLRLVSWHLHAAAGCTGVGAELVPFPEVCSGRDVQVWGCVQESLLYQQVGLL